MYIFATTSSSLCQEISNISYYTYGQMKLSDTTFYMLGIDIFTPRNLHFYKLTFSNLSPTWALKLSWPLGTWNAAYSESVLVSSSIYSFFSYGSTNKYVYLAVISEADGSVAARYKSSISWNTIYAAEASGDYIVASVWQTNLLVFKKETNTFTIKSLNNYLSWIELERTTGR